MAPHGENFCMEVRGDPYKKRKKGVILGNSGGLLPHGDLPATGLPVFLGSVLLDGTICRLALPVVPRLDIWGSAVITPAVTIAIVLFSIECSLAKLFAKKHDYQIDPNQVLSAFLYTRRSFAEANP